MSYPRVITPSSHIAACRKWATEVVKPGGRSERSRSVSLHEESATDLDTQLLGKLREVAVCIYYGLRPSEVLNLDAGRGDHYDVPLGPLRIDVKGSDHALAELMPYSVKRTDAGLYADAGFTHLLMVRDIEPNEFELCGWMTKQDFSSATLLHRMVTRRREHGFPARGTSPSNGSNRSSGCAAIARPTSITVSDSSTTASTSYAASMLVAALARTC